MDFLLTKSSFCSSSQVTREQQPKKVFLSCRVFFPPLCGDSNTQTSNQICTLTIQFWCALECVQSQPKRCIMMICMLSSNERLASSQLELLVVCVSRENTRVSYFPHPPFLKSSSVFPGDGESPHKLCFRNYKKMQKHTHLAKEKAFCFTFLLANIELLQHLAYHQGLCMRFVNVNALDTHSCIIDSLSLDTD